MNINVAINTPKLQKLVKALGPTGRKSLNTRAASRLFARVRSHIAGLAATRHTTAMRLGATPTGYFEKAANNTSYAADATTATVTIRAPGFRRVFGDVRVLPVAAKALTIPIHPMAYGKRVYELQREGIQILRPKGKNFLIHPKKDGTFDLLYVLVASALIRQDRTLLPTDDEMSAEAAQGIRNALSEAMQQGGSNV